VVREDTGVSGEGFWGCIDPDPHPDYWTKLRLFKEQLELITGRPP
jgi:hypothetical protein